MIDYDALQADGAQEGPRPYVVAICSLYDEDERDVTRVRAYGENDVRNQLRESHPGWHVCEITALCSESSCEHRLHPAGKCGGGSYRSNNDLVRCPCGSEYGEVAA